jgi:prephenate dehydrogenase
MKLTYLAVLALSAATALYGQNSTSQSQTRCNRFTGECDTTTTTTAQPNPWAEIQERNRAMEEQNREQQDRLNNSLPRPAAPLGTPQCKAPVVVPGGVIMAPVPCSSF